MNGRPKNQRALLLAVQYASHPELDGTDSALLLCLATNGDHGTGRNSRPGNRALESATKLKWSAVHERIQKNIRRGLIKCTEIGNGRGNASMYDLSLEHPAYPDYSPTRKRECLLYEKPSGQGPENHPVDNEKTIRSESKPSGCGDKPSGQGVENGAKPSGLDRSTPPAFTTNPPKPRAQVTGAGGWQGFLAMLPSEIQGALARKNERHELERLLDQHGPETLAGAVMLWVDKRELPLAGIPPKMGKWKAFLNEGLCHIPNGKAKYTARAKRLKEEAWSASPEGKAANEDLLKKLMAE
jgi:hypothetical protein